MGRLGDNHGRFLSVRPEVGLLTSTARTFIQEGITTEYATQVVGTTLDNGRFYAQYLKKSSRVLYENGQPSVLTSWVGSTQTRSYLQSHNDLLNAEADNWRDIDDQFVGNTDYPKFRSVSMSEVVTATEDQVIGSIKENTRVKVVSSAVTTGKIGAQKVLAIGDLPTITVKNHFEPSGYQTNEDIVMEGDGNKDIKVEKENTFKGQSKLHSEAHLMQKRIYSTVTYYGFADFTTVVGDSVIVFSPNSGQSKLMTGQVTSIQGLATLNKADIPAPEPTLEIANTVQQNLFYTSTDLWGVTDSNSLVDSSADSFSTQGVSLQAGPSVTTNVTVMQPKDEVISPHKLEVSKATPSLKLPTDKEILDLYVSLSKAQAKAEIFSLFTSEEKNLLDSKKEEPQVLESSIEQNMLATAGATTIFIDDDPFANFVEPTVSTSTTAATTINNPEFPMNSISSYSTSFSALTNGAERLSKDKTIGDENGDQQHGLTQDDKNEAIIDTTEKNDDESFPTTPESNESQNRVESKCDQFSSQVFLTQLSTNKIPSLAVDPTIEIIETTKFYCIEPAHVNSENPTSTEISVTSDSVLFREKEEDTTTVEPESTTPTEDTTAEEFTTTDDYLTDQENEEIQDYDVDEVDLIYKTLYTTYTYLTTFFQGESTTVASHTEIVTNVVTTPIEKGNLNSNQTDLIAQIRGNEISATSIKTLEEVLSSTEKYTIPVELESLLHASSSSVAEFQDQTSETTGYLNDSKYTKTFFTTYTYYTTIFGDNTMDIMSQTKVFTNYVTESSITHEEREKPFEEHVTLVTDIRSSSSNGHQKQINPLKDSIDDQVSSESNTEEIVPSATLLLQTSFTTFTFYTTMYTGNSTNVMSRLETVTNIATETLKPTKMLSQEEATLPITYFTTFTYWTKLAKDGEIRTISREETISNVIEPTESGKATLIETMYSSIQVNETKKKDLNELTTFYTTYTYYTTSYEANTTITNSRLETVTNIETPTSILQSATQSLNASETISLINTAPPSKSSEIIFYDYKHIIDAERVSTLYFTTQIFSTINEQGNPIEITNSSSTLKVDETKKQKLATETVNSQDGLSKPYRTGLVRLIEGTRIGNSTTTLYQSKVLGTIIENRYAQIIESTSSFLFENSPSELPNSLISISIQEDGVRLTNTNVVATAHEIQTSIISTLTEQNGSSHEVEEEDDTQQEFQTKKSTFAPVIRPFASRNRPSFAPKQKIISPSSATIITRSDITPTITATPALKTLGRFGSSRRSTISNASSNLNDLGTTSSRRLFSRPIKSSGSLSQLGGSIAVSSGFSPSRNRFGASRATPVSSSRRIGGNTQYLRSSSQNFRGTALQRIKPTTVFNQAIVTSSSEGYPEIEEEESSTEDQVNEEKDEQKQSQNPLLRFRRPLNRPGGFSTLTRTSSGVTISPRKNPLAGRVKTPATTSTTTTTTPRPKPRSFQRPTIARARPQSNLFPPRGLFQKEKEKPKDSEDDDSEYEDDDETEDEDNQNEANRRRRSNLKTRAQRVRRQVESVNRSRFRFRRPKTVTEMTSTSEELIESIPSTPRSKVNTRFSSRFQSHSSSTATTTINHRTIRPTRPMSPRTQFTLREKDAGKRTTASSSFRRNQQASGRRSTSSISSPSTSRRLKIYNSNNNIESSNLRSPSTTRSNRNRGTMRGRIRNDFNQDMPSSQLGIVSITVTHVIPVEVTIPVVNGYLTEYKQVVTGKPSLEVLGPHQYTQLVGNNGQSSLYLTREDSSVNSVGATELTRYLLHDYATTTVTFTPTTIRGRKTSFSHVLPSTVYSVEQLVSTLQPQISANAPLANILLSQLLLGNINLPAFAQPQATISGLGLGLPLETMMVASPVTEYRTHTSTYVTTIYDGKSTILPITFQGKKILTTVFDTTAQTITATEYSVHTIVNTPTQNLQTVPSQVPQVNSLLLQQLLLQQQQQQQPLAQNPILSPTTSTQIFLSENLQDLDAELPIEDAIVQTVEKNNRKKSRKSHKRNKPKSEAEIDPEGSVITLYISGRRPGEFSTVLSTVQNSLHKRQVAEHTIRQTLTDLSSQWQKEEEQEQIPFYFAGSERNQIYQSLNQLKEDYTTSLESSISDMDLWYDKATRKTTFQTSASF